MREKGSGDRDDNEGGKRERRGICTLSCFKGIRKNPCIDKILTHNILIPLKSKPNETEILGNDLIPWSREIQSIRFLRSYKLESQITEIIKA